MIWLQVSLFRLGTVVIYLDTQNDSEAKIRSQLKLLNLVVCIYYTVTAAFFIWETILFYTEWGK